MTQRVYATEAEYYVFTGGTDPGGTDGDLNAKLRRASGSIDGITRMSVYLVDVDGYPTDATISDVFRDATCAQVAYWEETDDVTGAASQDGTFTIGSVSIGARGRSAGNGAPDGQQSRIAPEAIEILVTANLLTSITAHT